MKLVTAVVRPHALDEVRRALERHAVLGLTMSEVSSYEPGPVTVRRGRQSSTDLLPRLKIETVVHDEIVDRLLDQLVANLAGTDGRLWVREVDFVLRVRTGERGADAV